MKKIGVGIIGVGDIARHHISAVLSAADWAKLVAVGDINVTQAREALAKYQVTADVHSDYRQLLQRDDVDLVTICLPNAMHAPVTIEALRAGKTVLCEKPIAGSLAECDAIIATMAETGRQAYCVFQSRYGNGYRTLKKLIDTGETGRLFSGAALVNWWRNDDYYAGWRGTWEAELGGCLVTLSIHALDVFVSVMGAPKSVYAKVATRGHRIETEDLAVITGVFENDDALGTFLVTTNDPTQNTQLRFVFENMTVIPNDAAYSWAKYPWQFLHRSKDPAKQTELDRRVDSLGHVEDAEAALHTCQIVDVIRYLREGGPEPQVSIAEARAGLEVITKTYLSSKTGRPVVGDVPHDSPFYHRMHGDFEITGAGKP